MNKKKGDFLPILKRQHVHFTKARGKMALLNVVRNADLSAMHDGLIAQAKRLGVRVEHLDFGQVLMFVNRECKYIKILMGTRSLYPVVSAYRFPPGMKLPLEGLSMIAKSFKMEDDISAIDKLKRGVDFYYEYKRGKIRHAHTGHAVYRRKERDVTPVGKN